MTVGHVVGPSSPVAHWLEPSAILHDADSEIVVVVSHQPLSSHPRYRIHRNDALSTRLEMRRLHVPLPLCAGLRRWSQWHMQPANSCCASARTTY